MNQEKRQEIERNLETIAQRENIPVEKVRTDLGLAVSCALKSSDPKIQRFWADIPCEGDCPTIEEIITYLADEIAGQK